MTRLPGRVSRCDHPASTAWLLKSAEPCSLERARAAASDRSPATSQSPFSTWVTGHGMSCGMVGAEALADRVAEVHASSVGAPRRRVVTLRSAERETHAHRDAYLLGSCAHGHVRQRLG